MVGFSMMGSQEGWDKLAMKGAETKVLPAITLVAGAYLIYNAATAGGDAWLGFLNLFDESRLVRVLSSQLQLMLNALLS